MDERLKQARELLKERERKATIKHLNNFSDNKQIQQLEETIKIWDNAPDLKPQDLQKLIKRFKDFRKRATKNQDELEEDLLIVLEEALEYNRTRTNPYSKKEQASKLGIKPDKIIYEDNSLLGLLIDLNEKCSQLDTLIGGLSEWPHSCSKSDWEDRIRKLRALKEIYPVRNNVSKILNVEAIKQESDSEEDPNIYRIEDKAQQMSSKKSTYAKYPETIELFMKTHYINGSSLNNEIEKTIVRINESELLESKKENIQKELLNAPNSTLYEWRNWIDINI